MPDWGIRTPFLKITDRITRLMGTVNTGTSDGAITVPNPDNGLVWFLKADLTQGNVAAGPEIAISGNVISWSFQWVPPANRIPCQLIYGVY